MRATKPILCAAGPALALLLAFQGAQARPASVVLLPRPALNVQAPSQQTDRLIVRYKNGDAATVNAPSAAQLKGAEVAANRQGVSLQHLRQTGLGAEVLKLSRRLPLSQVRALAQDLMSNDPQIAYAEPDRILLPQMTPSDAYYGLQWHYFEPAGGIDLPVAWDLATGAGVVVAVVDTGVRPHEDLAANLLPGYDFIHDAVMANDGDGRDADASDPGDAAPAYACSADAPATNSSWHGTHVAGTIAALTNNGTGVAGIAYGAKVLPVRALGRCGGYMSDVADGMLWAAGGTVSGVPANTHPARVINVSMGSEGACDTTFTNTINAVRSLGAVVVASAGNSNADAGQFTPASCPGVIAVAAVGRDGGKASYSNVGSVVALAAPGGDGSDGIVSTYNDGLTAPGNDNYAAAQGTSMAAPHVSGVAALMLSRNPGLSPDDVRARLLATARTFPASCAQCGAGIVDAGAAVVAADAAPGLGTTVDEVEPNDSQATPHLLSSGAMPLTINGTLSSSSDTDYFKLAMPGGGTRLTVTLHPNANSNYDLYAYNIVGRLVAISTRGTGAADRVVITNYSGGTGTLWFQVVYTSGRVGSKGSYSLNLHY